MSDDLAAPDVEMEVVNPVAELKKFVNQHDRHLDAAKALGISQQYLSAMLHKRMNVSVHVLKQLGLMRAVGRVNKATPP